MASKLHTLGLAFATLTITAACAHSSMRGTVVMKATPDRVHVCLGSSDLAVGDRVVATRDDCSPKEAQPVRCARKIVGHGVVVELLNDHYSVVRTTDGVLEEHDVVEKVP